MFDTIRRNEVGKVVSATTVRNMIQNPEKIEAIYAAESIQQRSATVLRDVKYVIDAHFTLDQSNLSPTDSAAKFHSIFVRRAQNDSPATNIRKDM